MRSIRAAFARLGLSLAGLVLGLLLAELLARAIGLGGPPRFFVKDASGGRSTSYSLAVSGTQPEL